MESNQGEWCMQMLRDAAPNTVANFLRYVNAGDYTRSLVHRSVPGFVIQGGGYEIDTQGFAGAIPSYGTIANEFNRSNQRGTVSMAKLSGDPNSATNQWFINLDDNLELDTVEYGSFTVFAEVVYGMSVVDKIAGLRVGDMSGVFGSGFEYMPVDISATATTVDLEDLVIITRAYATDLLPGQSLLPYHCTPDVPNVAMAELCGNEVTLPVNIQGVGYEATLQITATSPTLVFVIKPGSLKPLATLPATHASYNASTKEVLIPSVRVGTTIFDDVVLRLSTIPSQQLVLQTFRRR